MNILFLAHYYWPHIGGVEKHAGRVADQIQRVGNRITVITERYDHNLRTEELKNKVKIIRFEYPHIKYFGLLSIWFWLWKNRDLIKQSNIVHCHDVFIWYLPFRFLYPKKPVYTTIHGGQGIWPIPLKNKLLVKLAAKLSTGIICVGDFIPKYFGVKPDCVIYGGVDKNNKFKNIKEKLIIFLGRLEKDAGIYEFIKGINKYHDYRIQFVGDGSLRKVCKRYGIVHGFSNPEPYLQKASMCFAGGYLSALEALNNGCKLIFGASTLIKKDYWKMFPFKEGDKLPTWKDIAKIYESFYLYHSLK